MTSWRAQRARLRSAARLPASGTLSSRQSPRLPAYFTVFPSTRKSPGERVVFLPSGIVPWLPPSDRKGAMPTQPVLRPRGELAGYRNYSRDFWMDFLRPPVSVSLLSAHYRVS